MSGVRYPDGVLAGVVEWRPCRPHEPETPFESDACHQALVAHAEEHRLDTAEAPGSSPGRGTQRAFGYG